MLLRSLKREICLSSCSSISTKSSSRRCCSSSVLDLTRDSTRSRRSCRVACGRGRWGVRRADRQLEGGTEDAQCGWPRCATTPRRGSRRRRRRPRRTRGGPAPPRHGAACPRGSLQNEEGVEDVSAHTREWARGRGTRTCDVCCELLDGVLVDDARRAREREELAPQVGALVGEERLLGLVAELEHCVVDETESVRRTRGGAERLERRGRTESGLGVVGLVEQVLGVRAQDSL